METFWRHSLLTALLARTLAWRCRVLHPERLFVAGLLHDIGSLVLYNRLPELCRELLETAAGDEQALYAAEMQRLGFSHGHLGALLLGMWDLPETLTETVRHHHRPDEANGAAREAGIVHLAEALANGAGNGGFCELPGSAPAPEAAAWERIGLPPERADGRELVAEAGEELAVLTAALTGH
jgi:putative nucleotidyltransferase with HDIG domain